VVLKVSSSVYLYINLHVPRYETGGKSFLAQFKPVKATYCLPVPTHVVQIWMDQFRHDTREASYNNNINNNNNNNKLQIRFHPVAVVNLQFTITSKFYLGGHYEKHLVIVWNVGNHLSFRFWT
jgi:hypothetical protein